VEAPGFADGVNIFRPGTAGLFRREVKLMYDEGITGSVLLKPMFRQAMASLAVMHKRMVDQRRRVPLDPPSEITRCLQLMQASEILLRQLIPESNPMMQTISQTKDGFNRMWNVVVPEPTTVAQCKEIIPKIMNEEPDPFAQRAWSSCLF
jgi:hypothetical protein